MIGAILKIFIILLVLFLLAFPLLPFSLSLGKIYTLHSLRFRHPENRKNWRFALMVVAYYAIIAVFFDIWHLLTNLIKQIPFISTYLPSKLGTWISHVDFIIFVVAALIINFLLIYFFFVSKAIAKDGIPSLWKRWKNRKNKKKTTNDNKDEKQEEDNKDDESRKKDRIPIFDHSSEEEIKNESEEEGEGEDGTDENGAEPADEKDKKDEKKKADDKKAADTADNGEEKIEKVLKIIKNGFLSLFFEGEDFCYARPWLIRVRKVTQSFLYLVESVYLLLFALLLAAILFPMPDVVYAFLLNVLKVQEWYIYPIFSILFLQELCNYADAPPEPTEDSVFKKKAEKKSKEEKKKEARLRALHSELTKRFDREHKLRYYPEASKKEVADYVCTNVAYKSALEYIKRHMQSTSGRVVQSYMECLDATFNNNHVYFAASYYSELGEYVAAYTYIRLLSGARMIFVVSDPEEKETLKKHIGERLMQFTGSSQGCTWRIYTAGERLDQADVLIATPSDFADDNLIEQYPGFFEEVSNAVFIDSDKMVALNSYLCIVMSNRLQKATSNRIRFMFLSLDLLKGFAAATLPKFFCVDKVLNFSSAEENETVSYTLWNKESKNHRIYNKNGQKLTGIECIIAELARKYGVDGIRLITESPIGHAERKILSMHDVEINNMYRPVSDVNYMIYSDERCNLSAALYACARFRGKNKSIVQILSKPYLLREYFMAKTVSEKYINRSSFIQPRVTDHAERHRISLLRIFCEATAEKGMRISVFEEKMRNAINGTLERGDVIASEFCRVMLEGNGNKPDGLSYKALAAYLIAGLYDDETCGAMFSKANKAKDFYLIIDPNHDNDALSVTNEKHILFNRVKEIFDRLFESDKKVEMCINDETIGVLDTFPSRTHLEYIAGQSIIYDNSEYEIEHITEDGTKLFLRRENAKIKNCLDTVHLRRYDVKGIEPFGTVGVLHSTKTPLAEIRVTRCRAEYVGETYGFYSLTTDRQTIDFYRGVEGNPHVKEKNVRDIKMDDGRLLKVELVCRDMECNDGMRMLLSAVFNEFIKTIFPRAYRCVAIMPILAEPLPFSEENEPVGEVNCIKALYPYLQNPQGDLVETDSTRMQFLFINDCKEDIGVLDWFYDKAAFYMQEFLANVYSYLHWLKLHEDKEHYIYFGGEKLPECYDLDGLCNLFADFNWILSDSGDQDFETAGDDVEEVITDRCAFCHKVLESGRYALFSKHRYICAECFVTVDDMDTLHELYLKVREYLVEKYPDIKHPAVSTGIDPVKDDLLPHQVLSEYYYRIDDQNKTVMVERDDPETNVEVSLLRGIIGLWQIENRLTIPHAAAQLYFEELLYLRSQDKHESADWIYQALDAQLRSNVDEIAAFVGVDVSHGPVPEPEEDKTEGDGTDNTSSDDNHTEEKTDEKSENNGENSTDNSSEAPLAEGSDAPDEASEETSDNTSDGTADDAVEEAPATVHTSFEFMFIKAKEVDNSKDSTVDDFDEEGFEDSDEKLYSANKVPRFWKRYLKKQSIDDGQAEDISDALEENDVSEVTEEVPNEGTDDTAGDNLNGSSDESGETASEDTSDESATDESSSEEGTAEGGEEGKNESSTEDDKSKGGSDEGKTKDSKPKETKKKKRFWFFGKTEGDKMVPHEPEEDTNPAIRLYNDIVRAAYNYSGDGISRIGLSDDMVQRIFYYVLGDYPELFWVQTYSYTPSEIFLKFRCKDAYGNLDVKQVNKKRAALRKGAKKFTKGISRRTDPYEAFLKIYRRLILTLDYDGKGLDMGVDRDVTKDDPLRSLYSAIVENKVVCAGYAAALQYLLQSAGLVCGYVISEVDALSGVCHAFNMVKIGRFVYYVDATWGDISNTKTGDANVDLVLYDYCCVPYNEFLKANPGDQIYHTPRKSFYPDLGAMQYSNHEFFRYQNAYFDRYDPDRIAEAFARFALEYDAKTMGDFTLGFRCPDASQLQYIAHSLETQNGLSMVKERAAEIVGKKNKKALKLLERTSYSLYLNTNTCTAHFVYPDPDKKK